MLAAGFDIVRNVVPAAWLERLRAESTRLAELEPDAAHGVRDLLGKSPAVRALTVESWLRDLVPETHLCVRGILFDKTPQANWLVAWHQDLTVCVQRRTESDGYGPWSVKHGVPHVQPPTRLLNEMVTCRIHLDDTHAENGALRVIPGSHSQGKLRASAIDEVRGREAEVLCVANAGDVLRMRPLILHASSKAVSPGHRRIVHLEFAPRDGLAGGLDWYESTL